MTFSSSTPPVCTVSGAAVTLVKTGLCTIEADQAGNASFLPAPPVQQSFGVTKAAQSIAFADPPDVTVAQTLTGKSHVAIGRALRQLEDAGILNRLNER